MVVHYSIRGTRASEIAGSVEMGVREGRLAPGDALPPVRDLASTLGVSPATVAAAYRVLRTRGLVSAQGRRGTHIAPRPPLLTRPDHPVPRHLRDLTHGNPDPALLPPLGSVLVPRPRLYGEPTNLPALIRLARRQLSGDGIDASHVTIVGGAMDGIERVLQAHLRPGDRVAVEDPGYTGVLHLLGPLGLVAEPVGVDDFGMLPRELTSALRSGVRGIIVTPRAQNPTGAAFDERRVRELRAVLSAHPEVLVVEDDHAGPIAGVPSLTLTRLRPHWAVVRSVSKSLGPDLRLAVLAGDEETVARVEGRLALGVGWISHLLQGAVAALWTNPTTARRLQGAAATYTARRDALKEALARHGIASHGRSGLNVWIPVEEEHAAVTALGAAGWAVRGGERYRLRSGPAIRVTISALPEPEIERLAADLAASVRRLPRTQSA